MIYINLSKTIDSSMPEEMRKLPKVLKNLIYKIRKKLGSLYIKTYDNKVLITLPSINKKTLDKIEKYIKVKCIKRACLSNELLEDEEFLNFIKGQEINVLNGKWLYQHVLPQIIEYIVESKKEKLETQEISILTKDVNEVLISHIKELAPKVKLLNIITPKEEKFKKIEKELYEKEGILLNINNNYKKSLLKSELILNIDFEEDLNDYSLPKKACIISLNEKIKVSSKAFEGVCITDYEISLPRKYLKYLIHFKDFSNTILYESFIYKRTTSENIHKELEEDEFKIIGLIGKNGKIRKSELKNLSKNKNIF